MVKATRTIVKTIGSHCGNEGSEPSEYDMSDRNEIICDGTDFEWIALSHADQLLEAKMSQYG